MRVYEINREEFGRALRIGNADEGPPSVAGLAELARVCVARWRVAPRREVRLYLREQVDACGWDLEHHRDRIDEAMKLLEDLRDVQVVSLGGEDVLLPGTPRIVQMGDQHLLIGCFEEEPLRQLACGPGEVAPRRRWIGPRTLDGVSAISDLERISIDAWLGRPGYIEHAERREARAESAADLWRHLEATFEDNAFPVGDEGAYVYIGGSPGSFFGSARTLSGRWRAASGGEQGHWLGARAGHTGEMTEPIVVEIVESHPRRVRDLFNWDELLWAFYGRGSTEGAPELVELAGAELRFSARPPDKIERAVRAICEEPSGWRFQAPSPSAAAALRDALNRRLAG